MWTTEMLSSVVNISPGNSIPAKKVRAFYWSKRYALRCNKGR